MRCSICEKEKTSKEILSGDPIICKSCLARINQIPPKMSKIYYQGYRDGTKKGMRKERTRLRNIFLKRGREDLIEEILRR